MAEGEKIAEDEAEDDNRPKTRPHESQLRPKTPKLASELAIDRRKKVE
jgi:hypothetical protein